MTKPETEKLPELPAAVDAAGAYIERCKVEGYGEQCYSAGYLDGRRESILVQAGGEDDAILFGGDGYLAVVEKQRPHQLICYWPVDAAAYLAGATNSSVLDAAAEELRMYVSEEEAQQMEARSAATPDAAPDAVTDEAVARATLILFPHHYALSADGRDKLKIKVRAALEDASRRSARADNGHADTIVPAPAPGKLAELIRKTEDAHARSAGGEWNE